MDLDDLRQQPSTTDREDRPTCNHCDGLNLRVINHNNHRGPYGIVSDKDYFCKDCEKYTDGEDVEVRDDDN